MFLLQQRKKGNLCSLGNYVRRPECRERRGLDDTPSLRVFFRGPPPTLRLGGREREQDVLDQARTSLCRRARTRAGSFWRWRCEARARCGGAARAPATRFCTTSQTIVPRTSSSAFERAARAIFFKLVFGARAREIIREVSLARPLTASASSSRRTAPKTQVAAVLLGTVPVTVNWQSDDLERVLRGSPAYRSRTKRE